MSDHPMMEVLADVERGVLVLGARGLPYEVLVNGEDQR